MYRLATTHCVTEQTDGLTDRHTHTHRHTDKHVFTASDLHPISPFNQFCKYADDTYLLVPATNSLSIPSEIQHILDWATANNLKLNNSKSREMIVHLPRRRKFFSNPIAIPGI